MNERLDSSVRSRIGPTPPVQIAFQEANGINLACMTVDRVKASAYLLGGVIYRRFGSSDVHAQPEELGALVAPYAL